MTDTHGLSADEFFVITSGDIPGGPTAAGRWERGKSSMELSLRHTRLMIDEGWTLTKIVDAPEAKAAARAFINTHPGWKDDPKTRPRRER